MTRRRGDAGTRRRKPFLMSSRRVPVSPCPRVSAGHILEEHLWTPRLAGCGISLDKTETGPGGIKQVHIGVTDMVVRLALELGLHIGELVFQHCKVDADVMLGPEPLLVTDRAVRTASDEIAQSLGAAYHVHGDDTRGMTCFQRPINVKANELGQACASCIGAMGAVSRAGFRCGLCLPGHRPASSLAQSPRGNSWHR